MASFLDIIFVAFDNNIFLWLLFQGIEIFFGSTSARPWAWRYQQLVLVLSTYLPVVLSVSVGPLGLEYLLLR